MPLGGAGGGESYGIRGGNCRLDAAIATTKRDEMGVVEADDDWTSRGFVRGCYDAKFENKRYGLIRELVGPQRDAIRVWQEAGEFEHAAAKE